LQATRLTLEKLQDSSRESDETRKIWTDVEATEQVIDSWVDDDTRQLEGPISSDRVEELEARWTKRSGDFSGWGSQLTERVQELSDNLARLDELEGPWEATREKSSMHDLAEAVVERIRVVLAEIAKTRSQIQVERNAVLTLQDRVVNLVERSSTVLLQTRKIRREQQQNLMVVDSVPLWTAVWRSWQDDEKRPGLRESIANAAGQTEAYVRANEARVVGFILWIIAMALVVGVLRARTVNWLAEDPSLVPMSASLSKPLSGGFLLGALVFPWVFADRPAVVAALMSLVTVPPMIRFLSPVVTASVRRGLYVLAVWMLIDLLRNHLVPATVPNRLLLFVEDVAIMGAMFGLLRSGSLREPDAAAKWVRAIGPGLRVSLAILAAAVFANAVGNVSLARMLTNTLRFGLFAAGALIAAAHVIEFIVAAGLRTGVARRLRMVRFHDSLIRERLLWIFRVGLIAFWFVVILRRLQITDFVRGYASWILDTSIGAGDFELTLGDLVGAVLVFFVTVYLARFTRFVLEEDVLPRANLPRGVPYTVSVLAGYGIILLGSFASVAAAGIDMSRFALVLSALSVGIGIGLQDVVNNFVSGLILLFERPLKVGDTVEVAEVRGEIRHIGLRSSTVRTWDGSEVVIPNSRFIADQFTNWTLSDHIRRIEIAVGVAYGSDPVRVIEILTSVAESEPRVMTDPAPRVIMIGFGDSSLDFSVRIWTSDIDNWTQLRSDVIIEIGARLAAEGIVIPFPQRDLHIVSGALGPDAGEVREASIGQSEEKPS